MLLLNKIKNSPNSYSWLLALFILFLGVGLGYFSSMAKPVIVLAGLTMVILIIFIFQKPALGIFLIAFFLPFERIGSYDIAGVTIRISQVLAIVTLVCWLFFQLVCQTFFFKKNPLFFPLLLFLLINLLSLTNADNIERSTAVLIYTTFTILVSLVIPQLITEKEQVEKIVKIIIISAFIVGVFGIFQYLGDIAGLPTAVTGLRDLYTKKVLGFPRIQSTALEPLYFANYLLIPLGLLSTLFLSTPRTRGLRGSKVEKGVIVAQKINSGNESSGRSIRGRHARFHYNHLIFLIILLGINLVLTVSRGGYFAFLALLTTIGLFYLRNIFTPKKIIALVMAVVFVYLISVRFLGMESTFNLETFKGHVINVFYGAAYNERVETLQLAITGFHLHPFLGIGVGGFGPYSAPHPYLLPPDGWKIVNNEFVELLAEVGLFGFLSILMVFLILFFRSLKAIQVAKDKYLKAIMIGLFATFIGVIVQYQTFSILYIMHIWFLIGLMVAVQNIVLRNSAPFKEPSFT